MTLTNEQRSKVESNMGLVGKVIRDKVHDTNHLGMYTYDDLFQIGCIGLCKAAATDKGGTFSTYAYRLIWNEICDALIQSTRRQAREAFWEEAPQLGDTEAPSAFDQLESCMQLQQCFSQAKADATPFQQRCMAILVRISNGESSKEIGASMDLADNQVRAYAAKARKYLKAHPAMQLLAE